MYSWLCKARHRCCRKQSHSFAEGSFTASLKESHRNRTSLTIHASTRQQTCWNIAKRLCCPIDGCNPAVWKEDLERSSRHEGGTSHTAESHVRTCRAAAERLGGAQSVRVRESSARPVTFCQSLNAGVADPFSSFNSEHLRRRNEQTGVNAHAVTQ